MLVTNHYYTGELNGQNHSIRSPRLRAGYQHHPRAGSTGMVAGCGGLLMNIKEQPKKKH
jgi:hypothetical protein